LMRTGGLKLTKLICAYCKSQDTLAEEKLSARHFLRFQSFFSPLKTREKVSGLICIRCNACSHRYEALTMKNMEWVKKIFFTKIAIANLKTIFPRLKVDKFLNEQLIKSIKEVTKINNNNYHLIIEFRRKRAFIDCHRYDNPFVAVSVEEVYNSV